MTSVRQGTFVRIPRWFGSIPLLTESLTSGEADEKFTWVRASNATNMKIYLIIVFGRGNAVVHSVEAELFGPRLTGYENYVRT